MIARGLVIGAPRSGAGKTTVTIGILRALARHGMQVGGIKSGPDYLDPAFHAAATGRPGLNLDTWAMPPSLLDRLAREAASGAELLLVESAMGLFDGVPGVPGRSGAAADLASRFGLPVLLVLDVSGQSQTAAAVLRGFKVHDPAVLIAGVILNRVGSARHHALVAAAIEAVGIPVVGSIRRDAKLALPERHLGLVQAREHPDLLGHLDRLADMAAGAIDLDQVTALARPFAIGPPTEAGALPPPGQRIAIAADAAFTFLYPHLESAWRRAGAEIVPFSPLADEIPRQDCDVCWLPGGYPELYAGPLAAAARFRAGMTAFAESRPVHGECGGYMVLGRSLEDAAGDCHEMVGLLSHSTSFATPRLHLGYRRASLLADGPLGPVGTQVNGHEFHYARLTDPGTDLPLAELADAQGNPLGASGGRRGRVSGGFFHAIARAEL